MPKDAFLVDSIMVNRACYIQSHAYGTKFSEALPIAPRILMEIPSDGVPFDWEKLLHRYLYDGFRAQGLARAESKRAAAEAIRRARELHYFRASPSFPASLANPEQ